MSSDCANHQTAEYLFGIGAHHTGVSVMLGHSAHESNSQAQSGVEDEASYRAEFRVIFPAISDWAIDQIAAAYPESDYSSQGLRFADAKQNYDIAGKVLPITNAYNNQTYTYINYLGTATHGSDQTYWWYSQNQTAFSTSSSSSSSSSSPASGSSSASMSTGSSASGSSANSTSGGSSNSTSSSSSAGGAGGASGGMGSNSLSDSEIVIATEMQKWLLNFVISGDPNANTVNYTASGVQTIDSWPLYGSNDQVVEFSSDGFNITGDALDSPKVVVFNKALWY